MHTHTYSFTYLCNESILKDGPNLLCQSLLKLLVRAQHFRAETQMPQDCITLPFKGPCKSGAVPWKRLSLVSHSKIKHSSLILSSECLVCIYFSCITSVSFYLISRMSMPIFDSLTKRSFKGFLFSV